MWHPSQLRSGLLVDRYHVDSAYVAWRSGLNGPATFDLYTRHAPFGGAYLLAAGLDLALDFAAGFGFSDEEIDYLRAMAGYDERFLEMLRGISFTGEILAVPEGEIAFPDEPLLRVTAPFIEALLLESGLLHTAGVSTLLATKAARIVLAARGRSVAEFGFRRAQEPYLAARSAYIAGAMSTSFLSAARAFDIPATGTIPHALIEAFPDEESAFRAVAESLPRYSLLLDTYDVHRAIESAVEIAHDVRARLGHVLVGVRLDSGDLVSDSRHVRATLDRAGLHETRVLASGDLDEWRIEALLNAGAPIDGFGVGTSMAVGAGSVEHDVSGGALGAVYKLVWYEGEGSPARIKIAGEKSTWPGRKQVVRLGTFEGDVIQLDDEPPIAAGRPLLVPVMLSGVRLHHDSIAQARERAAATLASLPADYARLREPDPYPVERSDALIAMRAAAIAEHEPEPSAAAS